MKTAVLYIIFNRLDTVRQSFPAIRKAHPANLYIAADGPREGKEGETEKCMQVREWVLSQIDWDCNLHTRFQERNVGCGHHPADAISWLFENEESGIILEDDCVAGESFFDFADAMLDKYKDDKHISIICGSNFDSQNQFSKASADYFFSKISYTWGWATWRRNWVDYDFTMKRWNHINQRRLLRWLFKEEQYREYWKYIFNETYNNQPQDLWDYQFFFSCYLKRQMSIVPRVNLISNIGVGCDATHTMSDTGKMNRQTDELTFPLSHPSKFERNHNYDVFLQETCYGAIQPVPTWKKLKRFVKKLIVKC